MMKQLVSGTITIDVDSKLLATLRGLANREGAELTSLIEEALGDLIAKRVSLSPRSQVMAAYSKSHENFAPLYQRLA